MERKKPKSLFTELTLGTANKQASALEITYRQQLHAEVPVLTFFLYYILKRSCNEVHTDLHLAHDPSFCDRCPIVMPDLDVLFLKYKGIPKVLKHLRKE